MEKINIARLRELLVSRIANPQEYKGKSLILWNCDYTRAGILYQVIEESCIAYNLSQPKEDGAWFKYSDLSFISDDYVSPRVICDCKEGDMFGLKHKGILFNTGCYLGDEKEDWLTFINTHVNQKGAISENWVLVACAHSELGFTPDMFGPNCEIYELVSDGVIEEREVVSDEMLDAFDINSIPMSVLDKAWVDYAPLVDDIDYFKIDENGVYDETQHEPTNPKDVVIRSVAE